MTQPIYPPASSLVVVDIPPGQPGHVPPHLAVIELSRDLAALRELAGHMQTEVLSIGDLRQDVTKLRHRNRMKDIDKEWDSSILKTIIIMACTYMLLGLYMAAIEVPQPWLSAIVPTVGYMLSTLALPSVKPIWLRLMGYQ